MDKILLILGDQTSDIKRNLEKNFQESIAVIDSFNTPQDFAEAYKQTTLRVNRIIINESSIYRDPFGQMKMFKETLDNFYIQFDYCYILSTKGGELENLYSFLSDDETFLNRHKLKLYTHETFTAGLVTDYCLDKIPKRHFQKKSVEYDEIIRVRRDNKETIKIEDGVEDVQDETKIVLMDTDTVTPINIQEKLQNLVSSANIVSGEKWENNRVLKDLAQLDTLTDIASKVTKYEIDYSRFYNTDKIKTKDKNLYVVTGEKRSGTSTFAYGLAKSASSGKRKVLLLDFSINDFGLSYLVENQSDFASVMRLQDFKKDFDSALQTLVRNNVYLNVVALNSQTKEELDGIDTFSLLTLIANTAQKYFDCVIIDIDFDDLDSAVNLVSNSKKLIITVPSVLTSIYSLFQRINEESITELYPNTRKIIAPTALFNEINKNSYTNSELNRLLVKNVYDDDIGVLSKIRFNSFDVNHSLITSVDSI